MNNPLDMPDKERPTLLDYGIPEPPFVSGDEAGLWLILRRGVPVEHKSPGGVHQGETWYSFPAPSLPGYEQQMAERAFVRYCNQEAQV